MTEIVKDSENRDLFPEVATTSSSSHNLSSSLKIEKIKNKQASSHS